MFDQVEMAPADPILGLSEAFKKDPNPDKINLTVGVYKDEHAATPVLNSVKKAEERILAAEQTKGYLGIDGAPAYAAAVQGLVFGDGHEIIASGRAATTHTPGGTGGLRVAADFIASAFPNSTLWMSDPTWPNHPNIFAAAGVKTATYPYYDAANKCCDWDALVAALKQVPKGDFVLLHGCCHNPTGMDPSPEQWKELAALSAAGGWIPFFDFAYQGLADGIDEDAAGQRNFFTAGCELLVCTSFSKNFGLYNERTGALTVVAADANAAARAQSQVKKLVRSNYSNPPAHGGAIVTEVLNDPALRAEWESEVAAMRDRINGMRHAFVDTLKAKGVEQDFSFLITQRGMFSFSGLTKDQVTTLKEKFGVYIVGSGRINVAGMTPGNMDALCTAIAEVLKG
jgi:aspartate/tyrosine/aromatic aminotransferase